MIQPFIASNTSIPIPLLCRTEIPKKKKKKFYSMQISFKAMFMLKII